MVRTWFDDPGWQRSLGEQLDDQMELVRLVLLRQIDWIRYRSGHLPLGGTGSAVVTDADVLGALARSDQGEHAEFNRTSERNKRIKSIEGTLRDRAEAMNAQRSPFPLDELLAAFGLDGFTRATLTLALAAELDAALPRLLAYAQDDASLRHPTAGLALELFVATEPDERATVRFAFTPNGPLERLALIQRTNDPLMSAAARPLRLDSRVRSFLQGLDESSAAFALGVVPAGPTPVEFADAANLVAAALARMPVGARPPVINLVVSSERSAASMASAIGTRAGMAVHSANVDATGSDVEGMIAMLDRESVLRQTGYLIETGDEDLGRRAEIVERCAALVIVASRHPIRVRRPVVTVTVGQPAPASRRALWKEALGPVSGEVEDSLREVIHHFDLDPESIARVAASAVGQARLRGDSVSRRDVWQACRSFGRRRLGGLAERIDADFGWDDIVLPAAARVQLEEICAQVRHRATVYEDWDFARRLPRGRGVTALFAGPSGTGKTMAAEVLAHELDLDLYRIDLAGVVNKYIGETEKNLRRIFAAAEESGAILFFDEADALFGKRTDVRDSHDRYANIEIDYLLQRMEAYTGLAILATNRKAALDRAFLRRLRFLVDFPFPAADLRLRIWQKVLPSSAPMRAIDFGALSQLDLAGGSIQSVALNAAFLAASDGRVITMDHLSHAASREYAKLDKVPTDADFGGLPSAVMA
jgi:hypothetical protein